MVLVVTGIFYLAALEIEEDPFGTGMQPYVLPKAVCWIIAGLTTAFVLNAVRRLRAQAGEAQAPSPSPSDVSELKLFLMWVLPMAAIAFAYIGLMHLFQYLLPTALTLLATLARISPVSEL